MNLELVRRRQLNSYSPIWQKLTQILMVPKKIYFVAKIKSVIAQAKEQSKSKFLTQIHFWKRSETRKLLKTITALASESSFKSTLTQKEKLILPQFRTTFLKSHASVIKLESSVTFTSSTKY